MRRSVAPILVLWLLVRTLLAPAHAAGQNVPPPGVGPPPTVDFSGLPDSASVQQLGADGKPHPVHARLLADVTEIRPGRPFRLGVHLTQAPGWHTYWKSPGAVGKPTELRWSGPEGTTFGAHAFPAPAWFELSGIVSYGYEDQVLLFTEVTPPPNLPPGPATFRVEASWLVCEVQCIPGDAQLALTLPVVAGDAPPAASPYAALFDHFAATHPTPAEAVRAYTVQVALDRTAVRSGDEFKVGVLLTPTGAGTVEAKSTHGAYPLFTPLATPGWMMTGEPVVTELGGGAVRVVVPGVALASETTPGVERAGGLLQVKVDGAWVRNEVTVPLPFAAEGEATAANPSPIFDDAALAAVISGPPPAAPTGGAGPGFLPMLGFAFLGGILLNIMPCVLPVLTLKLYSLVGQADIAATERQRAGLAYTAGILVSFLLLAVGVVVLRESFGMSVGWGFQFQYPGYVIALGTVVFVFALNLFGVFEIPTPGATAMSSASQREGLAGYFLTGAFATLLATPCSAPFLGTGMGFAFTLPAWGITLFFLAAGFGLAFPFLLIAFVPALYRHLPRPGAWMETFKQFLGFTLIATTLWLVDVVYAQTGRAGGTGYLIFLASTGLGAWVYGRFAGVTASARRQAATLAIAVAIAAFTGRNVLKTTLAADECAVDPIAATADPASLSYTDAIPWQPFSEAAVDALAGRPVFIDFTADWCLTCKVNEKNVLDTETVRNAMSAHRVVPLKADWTRRDDTITAWLNRYGKAGVPFYLVIPADRTKAAIPLPEVITPDLVAETLADAR